MQDPAQDKASASSTNREQPPAPTLRLQELNGRSGEVGQWDVAIFKPRIEEWTYKGRQGAAFRCILVSPIDPTAYIAATYNTRDADMKPLKKALEKYK